MNRAPSKNILRKKKAVVDAHTHVGISPRFYSQYGYPYALSFEDLNLRMKVLGIDYSVVFPFVDSRYYEYDNDSAEITTTTKHCNFPYELENKNLLNEIYNIFPKYSHKALPFLMFDPSRETEKQADFMEGLMEKYPVFGLKTASTYIQSFISDLEIKGKPILDLVRKKELPITFHSSVHPKDPWAGVNDILTFAKHNPDIRVCIAHSARFLKPALQEADKLENCFVDLSAFIIHCRLAVQNSKNIAVPGLRFDADYEDPLSVMFKLAKTYPDTIIWGSDTPFNYWIQKYHTADGKLIEDRLDCRYDEESQLLKGLSSEIRTKITYTNTMRFLFGSKI